MAAFRQSLAPAISGHGRVPTPSVVERARADRNEGRIRALRPTTPVERFGRFVRRWGLPLLIAGFAVAYLLGTFTKQSTPAIAIEGALGGCVTTALFWRLRRLSLGRQTALRTDIILALLGLQGAFAVVEASGDRQSPLYPVLYLLAAFCAVAPWPRSVALSLVVVALVENTLRYLIAGVITAEWGGLVVQLGFIGAFAMLYHLIMAAHLWSSRASERYAVAERLREVEESARSLRLVATEGPRDVRTDETEEEHARRLLLGAILEVERSVSSVLEASYLALDGHALALYWLTPDEGTITLRDGRCKAGILASGPLASGDGILGSVLRHGQPVRQSGKLPGVNWYQRAVAINAVMAVPVIERSSDGTGCVRGVLVADRMEPEPFEERDLSFLTEIASQISRAVEAERLVGELQRARESQDKLMLAAERLNKAATLNEVTKAVVESAQALVSGLDLAALTRIEHGLNGVVHHVDAAEGGRANEVYGLEYDDNDGLVASVVRQGAPLPVKAPGILDRVKLFDVKVGGFGSLRVLPLHSGGQIIGTLVAGAHHRHVLDGDARRRLDALAVLSAGALARVSVLEQLPRMVTTDALTGLPNRRQVEAIGEVLLQEATRFDRPVSVLVLSVDQLRKLTDVRGRDAAEHALKSVAAILSEEVRGSDVVGKLGGNEFVALLPGAMAEGAGLLLNRVRARIEKAELGVSVSAGLAISTKDGTTLADLLAGADDALQKSRRKVA